MIEIIDAYPIGTNSQNGSIFGTLRVKLVDLGIELLGVFFVKKFLPEVRWDFKLPTRAGIDHVTGRRVTYPTIVFSNPKMQTELMAAIFEKGPSYIESRIADPEKLFVFPQKLESAFNLSKPASQGKDMNAQQNPKEDSFKTAKPLENSPLPKPVARMATMEFKDPPKRPTLARGNSKFARR